MKVLRLLTIIFLFFLVLRPVFAWDDCPRGQINDPYPGQCGNYVDVNQNGTCDHSEPAPQSSPTEKESIVGQVADKLNFEQNSVAGTETLTRGNYNNYKRNYHFGLIALILIVLYSASSFLSSKKIVSLLLHRKIWNSLLGFHFLVTALLGIILVIQRSYEIRLFLPFNILFWHVEAGIGFSLIAIFHIAWHWPYIKTYFPTKQQAMTKKKSK